MGFLSDIVGTITSPVSSLIGAGLSFIGQSSTNSANAAQSQNQMNFQENMSNTAYQRAVQDLKAAGLNPMLAYQNGGASTPLGASAVMGNPMAAASGSFSQIAQANQAQAQIDAIKSQADLNSAQADEIRSRTPQGLADVITRQLAVVNQAVADARLTDEQILKVRKEASNAVRTGELIKAQTGNISVDTELKKLNQVIGESSQDATVSYNRSPLGLKAELYSRPLGNVVNSAANAARAIVPFGR